MVYKRTGEMVPRKRKRKEKRWDMNRKKQVNGNRERNLERENGDGLGKEGRDGELGKIEGITTEVKVGKRKETTEGTS